MANNNNHFFDYIGSVWDSLPMQDRDRMGELWKAYEQITASVYQKYMESHLNINIDDLQAYTTERWLQYVFDSSSQLNVPAVLTSSQDLSLGINLKSRYLLKVGLDGGPPVEVDVRGVQPSSTKIDEIVAKLNAAFGFKTANTIFQGTVIQLSSRTSGVNSKITVYETSVPSANASEFILGVDAEQLPWTVPEYPYMYTVPYKSVASVPLLQDAIRPESVTKELVEGRDYKIDRGQISFKSPPLAFFWAPRTLVDQENPWSNFGFLMDIYLPNSPRYVNILQGLWYAFWTGPKPLNVKVALYLLFGLPVAPESGTITSVYSLPTLQPNGLTEDVWYIKFLGGSGAVRTYQVPGGLAADVKKDQQVKKFHPLVTGIDVFDKINNPGFMVSEIGLTGVQPFLTDEASRGTQDSDEVKALTLLEEYCFLPQISVEAFVNPGINLENVKTFLDAIKPLNKTYLFQVIVGKFRDKLDLKESCSPSSDIDVSPSLDSNEATYLADTGDGAVLEAYETGDTYNSSGQNIGLNPALNLDPETALFEEEVYIEVFQSGSLTGSFTA